MGLDAGLIRIPAGEHVELSEPILRVESEDGSRQWIRWHSDDSAAMIEQRDEEKQTVLRDGRISVHILYGFVAGKFCLTLAFLGVINFVNFFNFQWHDVDCGHLRLSLTHLTCEYLS